MKILGSPPDSAVTRPTGATASKGMRGNEEREAGRKRSLESLSKLLVQALLNALTKHKVVTEGDPFAANLVDEEVDGEAFIKICC